MEISDWFKRRGRQNDVAAQGAASDYDIAATVDMAASVPLAQGATNQVTGLDSNVAENNLTQASELPVPDAGSADSIGLSTSSGQAQGSSTSDGTSNASNNGTANSATAESGISVDSNNIDPNTSDSNSGIPDEGSSGSVSGGSSTDASAAPAAVDPVTAPTPTTVAAASPPIVNAGAVDPGVAQSAAVISPDAGTVPAAAPTDTSALNDLASVAPDIAIPDEASNSIDTTAPVPTQASSTDPSVAASAAALDSSASTTAPAAPVLAAPVTTPTSPIGLQPVGHPVSGGTPVDEPHTGHPISGGVGITQAAPSFPAGHSYNGHQLYINENQKSGRKGWNFYIDEIHGGPHVGDYEHVYANGDRIRISRKDETKNYPKVAGDLGGAVSNDSLSSGFGGLFPHASNYHHSDALSNNKGSGMVVGGISGASGGQHLNGWGAKAEMPPDPGSAVMTVEPHYNTSPLGEHEQK